MTKSISTIVTLALFASVTISATAQTVKDYRPTIAVPMFKSDNPKHAKYLAPITQKVTEMLRSSKRFVVVSRTDQDVEAEREFQKSEEFMDRKFAGEDTKDMANADATHNVLQMKTLANGEVVFYGAQYILQGEIRKLDIVKMLNADNSTAGYKALMGIQLSINTTATNTLSETKGFQSTALQVAMFSPERAVDDALLTLERPLASYFYVAFPLTCSIAKTIGADVMIDAGSKQGVRVGTRFKVTCIEDLAGEPVEVELGEIKVKNIASENFAQCQIIKGKAEILDRFAKAQPIKCALIIN